MSTELSFEWAVPQSQAHAIKHDLQTVGGRIQDQLHPFRPPPDEETDYISAAFEPLTIIAGAIALGLLVDKIVAAVKDLRHGGAIIDTRHEKLEIRSNPAVPAGTIVVVSNQEVKRLDDPRPSQLETLLSTGGLK